MPAISQAKTPCIAQLASELGYASKPTLIRHLERIDGLGPQVDPEGVYPEDWIVFRITGYRPDIDSPALVAGDALRGDLSAIAEKISEAAKLTADDIHEPYLTINSLAQRWSVSRKTIERYRRLGLIARRLDLGGGRRSVIFMQSAVEWFESFNTDRLGKAARFDRIPESTLKLFERWARQYRARLGWSRSQAAGRIAARTGHSHEGVRKVLMRIDNQLDQPIFTDPGPTTTRDQMFALRASLRGIEPGDIAAHARRSHNAVLRAISAARVGLMESFDLPESRTINAEVLSALESIPATSSLRMRGEVDLRGLIDSMRSPEPTVVYEELCWARAYHALVHRASGRLAGIERASPSAPALDLIETYLRWAGLLKGMLVRSQFGLILSTIEHRVGGLVDTIAPNRVSFLLMGSIQIASNAIDRFDPSHQGRIASPVGLAITRFASQQPDVAGPTNTGKAGRRIPAGHAIEDWTRIVSPWTRWLMPDRRIESVLDLLDERDRVIFNRRYGLDGGVPISRIALAEILGTSTMHCARFERMAIRNGLALVRANSTE